MGTFVGFACTVFAIYHMLRVPTATKPVTKQNIKPTKINKDDDENCGLAFDIPVSKIGDKLAID